MITAQPLYRSLKQISFGLVLLILGIAVVSLTAILLQRQELDQFRREVGQSVDAVAALSLELSDSQNALMLAASTYDPKWPKAAEESMAELAASMEFLDRIAVVTGNTASTDVARADLQAWLDAADKVLHGGFTAKSVATVEYPMARASLITISNELTEARVVRRSQHDAIILGGAVAIAVATLAALGLVVVMSRHYMRRLTTPLNQLTAMVDARVAGDITVRARTDQGFSEAISLAQAINALSDSNNALRAAQEATIHSHLLAEQVAGHLAVAGDPLMWPRALQTMREDLALDAIALFADGAHPVSVIPDTDDTWLEGPLPEVTQQVAGHDHHMVVVPLMLGGQALGTLVATRDRRRWSTSDADSLDFCSHHLAAALALQSVIETTRQLDEDKTRFLATTSHELRTPLTAVVAWLSMFEDGDLGALTDEQQYAMGVVERNIARLRDLIEDLLTVNQLDSGNARAVRSLMDVQGLACRVVESLSPMARRAGVDLVHDSRPCESGEVLGDPGQIERAITNIVQNALKFTETGGSTHLTTRCSDDSITLTCTDTGIGIPAADLPHVLERFRRADNAHGLPGTGLGLSIVDSIMVAHGGSFQMDSIQGVGTTVVLTLPRQASPAPAAPNGE